MADEGNIGLWRGQEEDEDGMMADVDRGPLRPIDQSMTDPSKNEAIGRMQSVGPTTRSMADCQRIDGRSVAEAGQPRTKPMMYRLQVEGDCLLTLAAER